MFNSWFETKMGNTDFSSLEAKMQDPVTAMVGPMDRLLRRLGSLDASQLSLPKGVSQLKIQSFKEDLQRLCVSFKDASETENASLTAKYWMKEVRELCYDTEDFFDEVTNSAAGVRKRPPLKNTLRQKRKVFQIHRKLKCFSIPHKRKLKRRPQIAKDFSELVARVEDASERLQILQLGPKTTQVEFGQEAGVRRLKTDLFERPMEKLIELMAFGEGGEKTPKVVSILGCAGIGKTTTARILYHKYKGKFQCRAFLRVSRNPDMRRLLSSLHSQIKAPPPCSHVFSDTQELIDCIVKHLQGKRYLIIIDDLWTLSVWDIITRAFPDGDCFRRIVTTTQIEDVALACCSYQSEHIFMMGPLNYGESRKLFFNRVFGSEGEVGCSKDYGEVLDGILRKCCGLPLLLVNIASLLTSEPIQAMKQWEKVQRSLPPTLGPNPTSQEMKEVLKLVYNILPSQLKTCLLYLSMYPEGYIIRKNELVKQLIAEGFVSALEGVAGAYLDDLVIRGMIQPVETDYNGEMLSFTVNHIVLDLIRYKSVEDNLVITVDYFQTTPRLLHKVRRLSVQFGGAKRAKIPDNIRMSHVRSLLFCGFFRCVPPIVDYGLLRVLVLHTWADQGETSFDLTRICELFRLRYLRIESNIIVNLPEKIGGLQCLETLEVDAILAATPSDIFDLQDLLYLRLPSEANLPIGIGRMTALHTMGYFDLCRNSRDSVMDIGKLTNLQDLHLTGSTLQPGKLEESIECLGSILHRLSRLKYLTLEPAGATLDEADVFCDGLTSVYSSPALLERLELSRHCCIFSGLPMWIGELGKLGILKIAVRGFSSEDADILKRLPTLNALSLYIQTAPVERMVIGESGFSALKYFKFRCSIPLLRFESGAMPKLQKMKLVFNGPGVDQHNIARMGIEHLSCLEEIYAKIGGAGADAESALMTVVSNHPRSPVVNTQLVDLIFHGNKGTNMAIEEKMHRTPEEEYVRESALMTVVSNHPSSPAVNKELVDLIFHGTNKGTSMATEEKMHRTPEEEYVKESALMTIVSNHPSSLAVNTELVDLIFHGTNEGTSMATEERMHRTQEEENAKESALMTVVSNHPSSPAVNTELMDLIFLGTNRGKSMTTEEKMHRTPEEGYVNEIVTDHEHNIQDILTDHEHNIQDIPSMVPMLSESPSGHPVTELKKDEREPIVLEWGTVVSASTGAMRPLLQKLASMLTDEYKLPKQMRGEIKFFKDELEVMHAYLVKMSMFAEPDPVIKFCMREMQEISYNVEDNIDKFMLLMKHESSSVAQGFKSLIRKFKKLLADIKIRHKVAKEVKNIKNQVQQMIERYLRYKVDESSSMPINGTVNPVDPRLQALFVHESDLVGLDGPKDELLKFLIHSASGSDGRLKVVSIVGCGGLGKTTLAHQVYMKVRRRFLYQAFVSISQKPDMSQILRSVLSQLGGTDCDYARGGIDLIINHIRAIRAILEHERYLIVIDDIWDVQAWNFLRFAFFDNRRGSILVTTTRINSVADSCCSSQGDLVYQMKPLCDADSKRLFYKRIFQWEEHCLPKLKQAIEDILKKCDGLPLAINTMSTFLHTYKEDENVLDQLRCSVGLAQWKHPSVEIMGRILSLSYFHLPHHLRGCLFYLTLFPRDYVIEIQRLVYRWISEGFIDAFYGQDLVKVGESYFYELVDRNLIQLVDKGSDGKARHCLVHGFILDLLISMSTEQNFCTHLSIASYLDTTIRRLSLMGHEGRGQIEQLDLSHARSLTLFGDAGQLPFLVKSKSLRVLDLQGCLGLRNHHVIDIGELYQLRYLNISRTGITELPSQIGDLRYLETLDAQETGLARLPSSVRLLQRLARLFVPSCTEFPYGIKYMINLQELHIIDAFKHMEELGQLVNLRKLHIVWDTHGIEGNRWKVPLVITCERFWRLESFELGTDCKVLMFEAGAMPKLKKLDLCFHPEKLQSATGDFDIGIKHLYRLAWLHITIFCDGATDGDVEAAEHAFMRMVEANPNSPKLQTRRVGTERMLRAR